MVVEQPRPPTLRPAHISVMPLRDDRQPDEERPLLGTSKPRSLASRWRKYLVADVNRDWADVILILCYFITGLLDSSSISVWGSFVSMQTGKACAESGESRMGIV